MAMNKEYISLNDQVIVTSDSGEITKRENSVNIQQILEVENKIEGLQHDIKYTNYMIKQGNILKKKIKYFSLLSVVFWPTMLLTIYQFGSPLFTSIKEAIVAGLTYSGLTVAVGVGLNFFNNKELKMYQELLNKQTFELGNSFEELDALKLSNTKISTKQEKINKLDLEQLKKYRASIIAQNYYDFEKKKIQNLVQKDKLRKKFEIYYSNDEYIYDELENIAKEELAKVKKLTKKI